MFRLLIALGVAYTLMPQQAQQFSEPGAEPVEISASDTLSAVQSIYSDVTSFCDRNPETCVTGAAMLSELEAKARAGLASLSEQKGIEPAQPTDKVYTGSVQ